MNQPAGLSTRYNVVVWRVFLLVFGFAVLAGGLLAGSKPVKAAQCLAGVSCNLGSVSISDPEGDNISSVSFSANGTAISCSAGGINGSVGGNTCVITGNMASSISASATYTFSAGSGSGTDYTVTVIAADNVGHSSSNYIPVKVYATPGTLSFSSIPTNPTGSASAYFAWGGVSNTTYYVTYLDSINQGTQTTTYKSITVGEGSHTFMACPFNDLGTQGTCASYTWLVDLTAPAPNPPNGYYTVSSSSSIIWYFYTMTDGGSGLNATPYSFDGGSTWQASNSYQQTGLNCGTNYSVTLRARDAVGNMTSTRTLSASTLTCDSTGPTLNYNPSSSSGCGASATSVTLTATDSSGVAAAKYCWVNTGQSCTASSGTAFSNGQVISSPAGKKVLYLWAQDSSANNNQSTLGPSGEYCYDNDTPTTPGQPIPNVSYTTGALSLSWTASTDATTLVSGYSIYMSFNGGVYNYFSSNSVNSWSGTLSSDGSYTFKVIASDIVGNNSSLSPASSAVIVDNTPPSQVNATVSPGITNNSFAISWTASADSQSGINHYELWRAPDSGGAPGAWSQIQSNIGGLSTTDNPAAGTWWYGIHAVNNVGLYATEVSSQRGIKDTTAPTPNPATGYSDGISQTSITWHINTPTDSGGAGLNAAPYSFNGGSTWQVNNYLTQSSLTCGNLYTVSIMTRDAADNRTAVGTLSASTLSCSARSASLSGNPSSSGWTTATSFSYTPSCLAQGGTTLLSCNTQVSTDGGVNWSTISVNPYTMTVGNSYRFRVVETDSGGSVTSASLPASGDIQVDNGNISLNSQQPMPGGTISSLWTQISVNIQSLSPITNCWVYLDGTLLTSSLGTGGGISSYSKSLNRSNWPALQNGSHNVSFVCDNLTTSGKQASWSFNVSNASPNKPIVN